MNLRSEGFGLNTRSMTLSVNHYPRFPYPNLTLGMRKHLDHNRITILVQDGVSGLQVFKDRQWISVEPSSQAFVINVGYQLQYRFQHIIWS